MENFVPIFFSSILPSSPRVSLRIIYIKSYVTELVKGQI